MSFPKTPLITCLIFFLIAGIAEVAFRTSAIQSKLPIPDLRTGYDPLEERLFLLDEFLAEHDGNNPDCIFLGSSSVETDINPKVFEAAYQSRTGEPINCYNFGIGAMTGSSAGIVGEYLIENYHPNWLIFGTGAIDFDQRDVNIEHNFPSTPWARYRRGRFNLTGWLIEHSYSFRYLNSIPDELGIAPRETPFIDPDVYKRVDGYAPLVDQLDFRIQEPSSDVTQADYDGFKRLVAASKSSNTRLLVVQMPIYVTSSPSYVAEHPNPTGTEDFRHDIIGYAREEGVPAWTTHGRIFLKDRYWRDTFHMHISGSLMFSQWLGEQFGEAIKQDEFSAPPLELELSFEPFTAQLGLSPEHYAEYETVNHNFNAFPPETTIFDPSENLYDSRELQTFIGLMIEWKKGIDEETRQQLYQFMALLERVQTFDDLEPNQQAAIETWRVSKSPNDLAQAGIEALFIPSAWYSFLSPADQATFEENYTLVARIENPIRTDESWFGVYSPVGN